MKTNLLFAAAFLLSTASFGQTSVQSASSVAASATVQTNAVKATGEKVSKTKNEVKQETKAVAEKTQADARSTVRATNAEIKKDHSVSASASTETSAQANDGNNKISQDASLNGETSLSTGATIQKAKEIKTNSETKVKAGVNQTVAATKIAKTHAKATVQAVKPRPVAIQAQTRINANGGIKIK